MASMDIGNLIALDTAALGKERLAQTPDKEAAKTCCAAAQIRRRRSR